MADVITRFRLETTQYDSALRSAAQQLREYGSRAMAAGNEFQKFTKGQAEAARALGNIAVAANNPKDKVRELVAAFNDAAKAYNALSKEQQKSDWGKALAESIQTLKGRISEAKQELYSVKETSTETGNIIEQLASKFGISTKALMGWGAAIGAAKLALDTAKDAFFQSESNIDEWGRTVEGAKGAYTVFINTLNNGNWSNFFTNLSTAVQGARDLYDALDRLGSIKANNQAAIAIVQQQIAQLRLAKQQGENVDAQIKEAAARLAALQKQGVDAGKTAGLEILSNIIRNEYNTQDGARPITQGSVDRAANELIQEGQKAFDKYRNLYQQLRAKAEDVKFELTGSSVTGVQYTKERYTNLNKLTEEEQKQYRLSKAITDAETRLQEGISAYANAVNEETSNQTQQFRYNRYTLMGSRGGGAGNGGAAVEKELTIQQQIAELEKEALTASDERLKEIIKTVAALDQQLSIEKEIRDIVHGRQPALNKPVGDKAGFEATQLQQFEAYFEQFKFDGLGTKMIADINAELQTAAQKVDVTTLRSLLTVVIQNGIQGIDIPADELMKKIIGDGLNIPDDYWQEFEDEINERLKEMKLDPIKLNFSTGSVTSGGGGNASLNQIADGISEINSNFSKVSGGISNIAGGLEQLGFEVPDGIRSVVSTMQGISSILTGISSLLSVISTASTISAMKFSRGGIVPHAASGYIVPGTHYSGDVTPILANAGEVVLNRSQVNNLAANIKRSEDYGIGGGESYVSGEQIILAANNYLRRRGYGEILTSKR